MVLTFKTEFQTVQNLASVEIDRRAWDKPVWNPVTKKELKWPNITIPPHTDSIYDSTPELHERVETSPIRYRNVSSKTQRLATSRSLQAGDARFTLNVAPYTEPIGPGTYAAKPEIYETVKKETASRPGTSSFVSTIERIRTPSMPQSPDTSNASLRSDFVAWKKGGHKMRPGSRNVDVKTWREPLRGISATESSISPASPFYNIQRLKSGRGATMFSEVSNIAPVREQVAAFSSSTVRLATLPNSRTADFRKTHSLGQKERVPHRTVQGKVWDGKGWVPPAQLMRSDSNVKPGYARSASKKSLPVSRATSATFSTRLGSMSDPVTPDGLFLFTELRKDLQGSAAMKSQGHYAKSHFLTDSSLMRKR